MFEKLNFFTSHKNRQGIQNPLPVHTDIHAHILPGIDDGVREVKEAANLAQGLEEMGIRRMFLTPHVTDEVFPNTPNTIGRALASLEKELRKRDSSLELHASAEYRVDTLLRTQLESGLVRPLPGNYLLIENNWLSEPHGLEGFVKELRERHGLKPILAHPERYPYYVQKPMQYLRLREMGLLFQVNLLSLAGYYGHKIRKIVQEMLEKNMVEFVGTDLHGQHHLDVLKFYLGSREHFFLMKHSGQLLNDKL